MATPNAGVDLDESRQPNIIVCNVLMWVFAAIFVALRLYTRARLTCSMGNEDWVLLAAMFSSTALSVTIIFQVRKGLGLHMGRVAEEDWVSLRFAGWLGMLFNSLSLYLTKISILLLYARIFTRHGYRVAIYTAALIVGTSFLYTMTITFLACRPLYAFWNPSTQICLGSKYWIASAVMHIGTDVLATILPLPMVFALNMRRKEKLILALLFALGFLVSITSFLRLYYSLISVSDDPIWGSVLPTYWASIEINVAIICGCLLGLRPFAEKFMPKLLAAKTRSGLHNTRYLGQSGAAGQTQSSMLRQQSETSWSRMAGGDSVDELIIQGAEQGAIKMSPITKLYSNHS